MQTSFAQFLSTSQAVTSFHSASLGQANLFLAYATPVDAAWVPADSFVMAGDAVCSDDVFASFVEKFSSHYGRAPAWGETFLLASQGPIDMVGNYDRGTADEMVSAARDVVCQAMGTAAERGCRKIAFMAPFGMGERPAPGAFLSARQSAIAMIGGVLAFLGDRSGHVPLEILIALADRYTFTTFKEELSTALAAGALGASAAEEPQGNPIPGQISGVHPPDSIATAARLTSEVLQTDYGIPFNAATRMVTLVDNGIHLSRGIAEMMRRPGLVRDILSFMVIQPGLARCGRKLTQQGLDAALRKIIEWRYSNELSERGVAKGALLSDMQAALGIDLRLAVLQRSDGSIVIATQEEKRAAEIESQHAHTASTALARRAPGALSSLSPSEMVAAALSPERISRIVTDAFGRKMELLLNLPGLMDPTEFERALAELVPYMHHEGVAPQFVGAAMARFMLRPPSSRKAIAEAMAEYGFNNRLTGAVAVLCSGDTNASARREAVNDLVAVVPSLHDPAQLNMAAASLFKLLEEEDDPGVVQHAISRMADRAGDLLAKIPELTAGEQIFMILRRVLLGDPKAYRRDVEKLLIVCGEVPGQRDVVMAFVRQELQNVTSPHVMLAYLNVLEGLGLEREDRYPVLIKRWRLYCDTREGDASDISFEIASQMKRGRPASIRHLVSLFNSVPGAERIQIISLLDEIHGDTLTNPLRGRFEAASRAMVVDVFKKIATSARSVPVKLAVLRAGALMYSGLAQRDRDEFWKELAANLPALAGDESFVVGFAGSSGMYWVPFANYLRGVEEPDFKFQLLGIAFRKSQEIDPESFGTDDERSGAQAALDAIAGQTADFIGSAPPNVRRGLLFEGISALAGSPLADAGLAIKMLGACRRLASDNPEYLPLAQRAIASLSAHPELRADELQPFIDAYLGVLGTHMIPAPTMYGNRPAAVRPTERHASLDDKMGEVRSAGLLSIALDGLANLFDNPTLSGAQQQQVLRYLLPILGERIAKRKAFISAKKEPPTDPFFDSLVAMLRRISGSEHIDPILKRVIEADLGKLV